MHALIWYTGPWDKRWNILLVETLNNEPILYPFIHSSKESYKSNIRRIAFRYPDVKK